MLRVPLKSAFDQKTSQSYNVVDDVPKGHRTGLDVTKHILLVDDGLLRQKERC
jgi:hypothetical protein